MAKRKYEVELRQPVRPEPESANLPSTFFEGVSHYSKVTFKSGWALGSFALAYIGGKTVSAQEPENAHENETSVTFATGVFYNAWIHNDQVNEEVLKAYNAGFDVSAGPPSSEGQDLLANCNGTSGTIRFGDNEEINSWMQNLIQCIAQQFCVEAPGIPGNSSNITTPEIFTPVAAECDDSKNKYLIPIVILAAVSAVSTAFGLFFWQRDRNNGRKIRDRQDNIEEGPEPTSSRLIPMTAFDEESTNPGSAEDLNANISRSQQEINRLNILLQQKDASNKEDKALITKMQSQISQLEANIAELKKEQEALKKENEDLKKANKTLTKALARLPQLLEQTSPIKTTLLALTDKNPEPWMTSGRKSPIVQNQEEKDIAKLGNEIAKIKEIADLLSAGLKAPAQELESQILEQKNNIKNLSDTISTLEEQLNIAATELENTKQESQNIKFFSQFKPATSLANFKTRVEGFNGEKKPKTVREYKINFISDISSVDKEQNETIWVIRKDTQQPFVLVVGFNPKTTDHKRVMCVKSKFYEDFSLNNLELPENRKNFMDGLGAADMTTSNFKKQADAYDDTERSFLDCYFQDTPPPAEQLGSASAAAFSSKQIYA